MTSRLNPYTVAPELTQLLIDLSVRLAQEGLEHRLVELVKIRASQINGCAVCLHMHTRDARKQGETEERIFMLDAWKESQLYTSRERAALAWTDALTRLSATHAPDDAYEAVEAHFTERDRVTLTLLIGVINSFNKLGVGFRVDPAALDRPIAGQRQAAA
jgi:AhpD family alkylhydroperoxidase